MYNFDPTVFYLNEYKNIKPALAFDKNADFATLKTQMKAKFTELLKMPEKKVKPEPIIEYTDHSDPRFDEIRFIFETEPGLFVPCHLLTPKNPTAKLPVMICLQGHSTGMHISLARPKFPGDEDAVKNGDRDFGITAVAQGYAALVMEQRGFGERIQKTVDNDFGWCHHPVMQGFMLGRTMMGDRVFDVMQAIDMLPHFEMLDTDRIGIMGNSGGGTVSFYAACMDERIKAAMPSCSFCTFEKSIFSIRHCQCNYIPELAFYFDMPDLAMLIAPRPLVIVAGRMDPIFMYEDGVVPAYQKAKDIYAEANAAENCTLVTGEEGHRFYAQQGWTAFNALAKLL